MGASLSGLNFLLCHLRRDRRQHLSRYDASPPHCAFAFWSSAVCPVRWRQSADAWYSVRELHLRGLVISHLLLPLEASSHFLYKEDRLPIFQKFIL